VNTAVQPRFHVDKNPHVLIIDDSRSIHDDFRKILTAMDAASFTGPTVLPETPIRPRFEIDSAFQGEEGLSLLTKTSDLGSPYAMAFVDVKMPPGWDGVETAFHLWEKCPDLQIVMCTGQSDYTWDELVSKLSRPDQLVILKKPFEAVEVMQLAHALTEKWRMHQSMKLRLEQLEKLVQERTSNLRVTHAALETMNRELNDAMAKVKTLEGLLPICAHCKQIRDKKNVWIPVEHYIHDHSNVDFSHGICPDCARLLYPEFVK
jgi:two-component system sensor histidine kinase/response regulator